MKEIHKKINSLSKEDRIRFARRLTDNLYDKDWCNDFAKSYSSPDIKIAMEKTYQEIINNHQILKN